MMAEGKVCAIAGAGSQVGAELTTRLKAAGWKVAGSDRDRDRCEGIDLDDVHALDLLDESAAKAWAYSLGEHFGRVDALVHLVGGWRGGKLTDETPADDVEWLHDLLMRTVHHTTRAFLPALRASGGRFVLVSSKQAQQPDAKNAAYAAAKAGAETWALAVAADLADHGGTANIVVVNAIGDDKPSFTPAAHVAGGIAFVLSDEGSRMNGRRLSLHG
ncbi:MAG: hypothetical protein QOG68_1608 [Solirubrobacteraceae bacterium]|nr:hypothetical protein [Solirubrobacteraceae bacterium]